MYIYIYTYLLGHSFVAPVSRSPASSRSSNEINSDSIHYVNTYTHE